MRGSSGEILGMDYSDKRLGGLEKIFNGLFPGFLDVQVYVYIVSELCEILFTLHYVDLNIFNGES